MLLLSPFRESQASAGERVIDERGPPQLELGGGRVADRNGHNQFFLSNGQVKAIRPDMLRLLSADQ